tara:strand:+ start:5595 stop:6479 length:885 start_codon:yes stop_codon:yes gene_type:complete
MMLSVALLWGVAWPVGRILATDLIDYPFSVMFLRYTFALPVLFIWMWYSEGDTRPNRGDWKPLFFMAFTSVFLYQIGYMFGMQRTAASDASLVIGFNPVVVSILSVWFFSHQMSKEGIFAVCLSFTGVILIFLASPNVQIDFNDRIIGNGLIMFGAFAYALYVISMRSYVLKDRKQLSSLALIAWVSLLGWLMFIPFVVYESSWTRVWIYEEWLLIAYLGVLSTALSYVFFAIGVDVIGATRASSFINVVPVFGILSSWLWLKEELGLIQLVSFGLIYFGVTIVNKQPPETNKG